MSIKFRIFDLKGERTGCFADALYWDYNEIAKEIDEDNNIAGAIDWMCYNVALTEDIYGVITSDGFLIYDIGDVDMEDDTFGEDPAEYLSDRPELLVCKFSAFVIE